MKENDGVIQTRKNKKNKKKNGGMVSNLRGYEGELRSMEQRLMGGRMNKNGSSVNPGSKGASYNVNIDSITLVFFFF